jgi:hypothetical protein
MDEISAALNDKCHLFISLKTHHEIEEKQCTTP